MNAATVRKNNHAMRLFEYNINRILDEIDKRKRSKEADSDVMAEKYQGVDKDGNRSWGPW